MAKPRLTQKNYDQCEVIGCDYTDEAGIQYRLVPSRIYNCLLNGFAVVGQFCPEHLLEMPSPTQVEIDKGRQRLEQARVNAQLAVDLAETDRSTYEDYAE
jgi:hypothetical protein